jgi:Na+/phosphate symporter
MVAMATSLSDRAWDRDSAVYRISGVFTVTGGWFLTAVFALFTSGFIALIISISGKFMVFVFLFLAIALIIKSHLIFRKRTNNAENEELLIRENDPLEQVINKSTKQVVRALYFSSNIINLALENFLNENRAGLKDAKKVSDDFSKKAKKNKDNVYRSLLKISDKSLDSGHFYVQIMDYKREMAHALHFMLKPMVEHADNNHKPFTNEQSEELIEAIRQIEIFNKSAEELTKTEDFGKLEQLVSKREEIFEYLHQMKRTQIKRIRNKDVNTRNSQLFFKIITELENTLLHTVNLIKSHRDFIIHTKQTLKNQTSQMTPD